MNKLTAVQQSKLLNAQVGVKCEGLLVSCTILDIKQAYGRYRFQVQPVAGSGSMWVEDSRLIGLVELLGISL
jgi:hypothetical protein